MAGDEEEDDYMNMTFDGLEFQKQPETNFQRLIRERKEAAERDRPKTVAERAEMARVAREEALATPLPPTNRGAMMMAKMGYKPGSALGKSENALMKPIEVVVKSGRGGIGADSAKKRKLQEMAEKVEAENKRQEVSALNYRDRLAKDQEEKRIEAVMWSAMRTLERIEILGGKTYEEGASEDKGTTPFADSDPDDTKPLTEINFLYRDVVARRREKDQQKLLRSHDGFLLPSKQEHYAGDQDDDKDDKFTFVADDHDSAEQKPEDNDEFTAFQGLSVADRLERVVVELRNNHFYCFWCKFKYPDSQMLGCPGASEDEHG
nr:g patch domain-containing protein 11 [Quercus suber]